MSHQRNRKPITVCLTLAWLVLILTACAARDGETPPAAVSRTPLPVAATPPATPDQPVAATTAVMAPGGDEDAVPAALSFEALGNATYQGILDGPITLTNGLFEGAPVVEGSATRPTVTLLPAPVAYGDLSGAGQADSAALLRADTGGSGAFIYLAAVAHQSGRPINVATILLGDRVQVKSLSIDDGLIRVTLLTQGPDDPQCCPSQEVTRFFRLSGDQLVEEDAG